MLITLLEMTRTHPHSDTNKVKRNILEEKMYYISTSHEVSTLLF